MPNLSRRTLMQGAAGLGFAATFNPLGAMAANNPLQIAIIAKIRISWFNDLEIGIKKAGKELGVNAWMIAPTTDDAAQQVRAVEDLIAKKVDVIGVVPNDGHALEPVLKRAKDAGIIVITQESPGQKNSDWDIELIQNTGFGEAHMEAFAKAMNYEGDYIVYVGGLTVLLHNQWADAAVALQKAKYPKMRQIGDRFGVSNSVDDSYKTTIDQMRANPNLKGVLAFGVEGPIGAARAVEDRELIGKFIVVGPIIPSEGKKYIKNGAIEASYLWSPILTGEALVELGKMLAEGKQPTDGMDFPRLGKVQVEMDTHTIRANTLLDINKDTVDELAKQI